MGMNGNGSAGSPGPLVSVVIPTHNGEGTLRATLAALHAQTLPSDQFEVIVVDDGSSDRSRAVAAASGARTLHYSPNRGAARARNTGWKAARAPVVAFLDDDCVADPHWLAELTEPFADLGVDGVGGCIIPAGPDGLLFRYIAARNPWQPLPSTLLASTSRLYRLRLYLREVAQLGVAPDPPAAELFATAGANMAFRKQVLEELGGFDESYRVSEDTEFCRRAHRQRDATRIVYRPAATVHHHFEPHLGGILRRARWYGEGNARFAARHDDVSLVLFPFPILLGLAAAAAAAAGSRWARAAAPLLPLLAYSGWVRRAVARRQPEALIYPYLQMAQEVATMAGEASAVLEDLGAVEMPSARSSAGTP